MKPSVYLETTIVSYLVGWLNRRSVLVASNQELTREWWTTRKDRYELFASTVVIDEASKGDDELSAERLTFLRDVALLEVTVEARRLSAELMRQTGIPRKAEIGRAPHRGCRNQRNDVSTLMELHAHRKCLDPSASLRSVPLAGI